jgi:tRNA(Ile)-lysidine synthase
LIISNGNIVWIAGLRLDDRYRVDKDTKRVLQLEIRHIKV